MTPRNALVGLWLATLAACAGGRPVEVHDLDGRAVQPLTDPSERLVVLLFTATECPISNRYAPEVRRLAERFGPRGVRFWLVFADPAEAPEAIRRHVSEFNYGLAALRDPAHALVRLSGARVTPEAAVFTRDDAGPRLVYRGRIDDWYVDFGRARAAPSSHELADALAAALAGRPVPTPRTTAIGCAIPGPA